RHHGGVVFQDGDAQTVELFRDAALGECSRRCVSDGPAQLEAGADAAVEQREAAAAALGEVVRVGEADAGASGAPRRADAEQLVALIDRNARAVVANAEDEAASLAVEREADGLPVGSERERVQE